MRAKETTKKNKIMTDKQVIEILQQQNERLLQILERFADKEQHVNVVVNSYNGSEAKTEHYGQTGGIANSNSQENPINE